MNYKRFMHMLKRYCKAIGQLVNHQKSSLFFSRNTPVDVCARNSSILEVECTDNPGNYLGMPTVWGRSKEVVMNYVKESVKKKILE